MLSETLTVPNEDDGPISPFDNRDSPYIAAKDLDDNMSSLIDAFNTEPHAARHRCQRMEYRQYHW